MPKKKAKELGRRRDREDESEAPQGLFGVKGLTEVWKKVGETVQGILDDVRQRGVRVKTEVTSPWGPIAVTNTLTIPQEDARVPQAPAPEAIPPHPKRDLWEDE